MQIVSLKLFKYHFVFRLNFNKFSDKEAQQAAERQTAAPSFTRGKEQRMMDRV